METRALAERQQSVETPDDPSAPEWGAMDMAANFTRGLAMGAADIVPGVSGGTIAFISGIYERFIAALRSISPAFLFALVRGRPRESVECFLKIHWALLVPLGAGIGLAIIVASRVIPGLMEDQPGPTYAMFFGLILASSWIPIARTKKHRVSHVVATLVFAAGAYLFVGMQPEGLRLDVVVEEAGAETVFYAGKIRESEDLAVIEGSAAEHEGIVVFDPKGIYHDGLVQDPSRFLVLLTETEFTDWTESRPALRVVAAHRASLVWIFFCGTVAISAMILPGLSGAFLLLFLGQYHAILGAIKGVQDQVMVLMGAEPDRMLALSGQSAWADLSVLVVFGLGVLVGLAVFSRVVGWLFEHRHDVTMAALTGLMLGALRHPGAVVLEEAHAAESVGRYWMVVVVLGLLGAVFVTGLTLADARLRARSGG